MRYPDEFHGPRVRVIAREELPPPPLTLVMLWLAIVLTEIATGYLALHTYAHLF